MQSIFALAPELFTVNFPLMCNDIVALAGVEDSSQVCNVFAAMQVGWALVLGGCICGCAWLRRPGQAGMSRYHAAQSCLTPMLMPGPVHRQGCLGSSRGLHVHSLP